MEKLIVIAGPTASGKTACAVELAKLVGGEVISADSMQVYRGMDILSAKPDAAEMDGIPHHMLSVADPEEKFSCGAYREMAAAAIESVRARGKTPILCGGTGLYIDSLTRPMSLGEKGSPAIREKYEKIAEAEGKEALHAMLAKVDPERAEKLHVNDLRRVVRALEIYELTGLTQTEREKSDRKGEALYEGCIYALDWPREVLYDRINRRCGVMLEAGLLEEVKALMEREEKHPTSFQAIGYKEMTAAVRGEMSVEEALDLVRQASRNYAKRQLTWLRRDERAMWIDCMGKTAREIAEIIREKQEERNG